MPACYMLFPLFKLKLSFFEKQIVFLSIVLYSSKNFLSLPDKPENLG